VTLDSDDVQIRLQAKEGWAAAQGRSCVVVLATELSEELEREGLARDLVRAVQDCRKFCGCEYTQRIRVTVFSDAEQIGAVVNEHQDYICGETLAESVSRRALTDEQKNAEATGRVTKGGVSHLAFAPTKYRIGEHDVYVGIEHVPR